MINFAYHSLPHLHLGFLWYFVSYMLIFPLVQLTVHIGTRA